MVIRSRTTQRDIYRGTGGLASGGGTVDLRRPTTPSATIRARPTTRSIFAAGAARPTARGTSAGDVMSFTPTAVVGTIGLRGPATSELMSQPQDTATTPTLSLTSVGSGISSTLGSVGSGVMNTIQSLIPIAIKLILLYIGVKVVLWLIRSRR